MTILCIVVILYNINKGAMLILSTSGTKGGTIQKPKNKAIATDEPQMRQIINSSGAYDNHQHDKHDEHNKHNEHSHEDLYMVDHGVTSPAHDNSNNNDNNNINLYGNRTYNGT